MNKKLLRIILSAVLLLAAWLVNRNIAMPVWGQLLVYLVPYLIVGYDVLGEAWEGIREGDPFDEDFLMAVATTAHRLPPRCRTTVSRGCLRDAVLPSR